MVEEGFVISLELFKANLLVRMSPCCFAVGPEISFCLKQARNISLGLACGSEQHQESAGH